MEKQQKQLQVDLVETTSVLSHIINNNCTFDGSNIIYLAGTSIVFHNVFQNLKHFRPRLNDYQVQAMMFYKTSQVSTALVTKVPSTEPLRQLQFYMPDKNPVTVELHEDITVYDGMFIERNKVCLLCHDHQDDKPMMIIVSSHRKLKRIPLEQTLVKFCQGDRRVLLKKKERGCIEFNTETETLEKSQYSQFQTKQILNLDQAEILITKDNTIHVFVDKKQVQVLKLQDYRKGDWGLGVRVGRNILMAFKNELVLGNFQWAEGTLRWVGCFEYTERLRANIICMQNSADEMNMALVVQIFYKDTWIIQHFMFNLAALSNEKKFINAFNRLTPYGSQMGDCMFMQRAITSQIYMLSGSSIVNYSYVDHIEKKHKYVIHESPRMIALHPLGYQIMCTFEGAIKFYQKVQMELVELWTETWNCTAAKYTQSGLLLLSIFEEGTHQVVLYNPNSFTRLKNYTNLYIKHAITSIELDETQTDMILFSGKDISVYKFKTGQKQSQFREKREGLEANCVQYDSNHKQVIVGMNKKIIVCRKTEEYHLNFTHQKYILLEQNVTCVIIKENAGLAFLGTSDGKIIFTEYPFDTWKQTINDETVNKINIKAVRVHSSPTSDLLLTNNGKFLFAASKGEGLAILRLRRSEGMGGCYNSFDISNYNFIETSSKPYLEAVQEKLKVLLEKRKAIFNELDEFKKEWEAKRQRETKNRNLQQKKKELSTVNAALDDIGVAKALSDKLTNELKQLQQLEFKTADQYEKDNHQQLLVRYAVNDDLKDQLQEVQKSCSDEYWKIQEDCKKNLEDIEQDMRKKFTQFEDNYKMMRHNLLNFALRAQIEEKQEQILGQQQIQDTRTRLRKEQDDLYKKNHELKAEITRNKKQLQRFANRKDFLQNKQRFFKEELRYCSTEEFQLNQIKEDLQEKLAELQSETEKKEKKLRKYFFQNDVLIKYQEVHSNLAKTTERQIKFIEDQRSTLRKQINQLQRQILQISQNRSTLVKQIKQKQMNSGNAKQEIKKLKNRGEYLQLQIRQLERLLSRVGPGRENQLQGLYEKFFVGKRLEGVIKCPQFEENEKAENKQIQSKIREQLHSHKNYLVNNMNMFEKCNAKIFDEIQTSYMKYQSENYALISECNMRKQQITKKKRIFQQMVNSMRQTEACIQQINNGTFKPPQTSKHQQQPKIIPFIEYEKHSLRKQQSEPTLHKQRNTAVQVRKMLDVQRCALPESRARPTRRIQTAQVKKHAHQSTAEQVVAEEDCGGWFITKPQTPSRKSRGAQQQARRLFSRNKSRSKPTTCTTHSKYSVFI